MTINTRCNLLKHRQGRFHHGYRIRNVKRGFDRGRARAFAEVNRELAAYYKRMQEARERGEEFNEPPPMFGEDEGQEQD